MPIYVYEREDGSTFEVIQRMSDDALTTCPDTGQKVQRQISASTPIFKGSGYYTNGHDAGRACYILDAITGQVDGPGNLHLKDWAPVGPPLKIPEEAMRKPEKDPLHVAMGYPLAPDLPNSRLAAYDRDGFVRGIT